VLPYLGKFPHFGEILGLSGEIFYTLGKFPKWEKFGEIRDWAIFLIFYVVNEKILTHNFFFQIFKKCLLRQFSWPN